MVVNQKSQHPHGVRQQEKVSPPLVLLGAAIREHVHPECPEIIFVHSAGGGGCLPRPVQAVLSDFAKDLPVEIKIMVRVLGGQDPCLGNVHPPPPS